jgi:hypothetical protein
MRLIDKRVRQKVNFARLFLKPENAFENQQDALEIRNDAFEKSSAIRVFLIIAQT